MHTPSSTLLLPRSMVARLATPHDYLDAMRAAFRDLGTGRYELPAVGHIPAGAGTIHIKTAARRQARAVIKVNANHPGNAAHGLPTIQGFVALFDADCGRLLALMDSIEITARRTAAVTALAVQLLARSESATLGVVGCGAQARYHLDALLGVAKIERVQYCDVDAVAAEAFGAYARRFPVASRRVTHPRAAAHGADIVITLTSSRQPLLSLDDIAPGTLVAGIGADNPGKNELAADLLAASHVVVDLLPQAAAMGDLHHAIRLGVMQQSDVHAELAQVVCGSSAGRTHAAQRFVFDSTGIGAQDLAAAELIYQRACERGEGATIALDDLR